MERIEHLLYNSRSGTFFRSSIQQCWADLAIWEILLNKHELSSLLELGTGHGAMSIFLLCQCIQRGIEFQTIDRSIPPRLYAPLPELLGLKDRFTRGDVFAGGHVERFIQTLPKPLLLFCDNGDKRREFKMFVPLLEPGDFVAVHDWGQEIDRADVEGYSTEPIMQEDCEKWRSITRFWRIV